MGSTAINRCVALSEFDVSDAHISNNSASHTAAADAVAADTATSTEHLPSDNTSVIYAFSASIITSGMEVVFILVCLFIC